MNHSGLLSNLSLNENHLSQIQSFEQLFVSSTLSNNKVRRSSPSFTTFGLILELTLRLTVGGVRGFCLEIGVEFRIEFSIESEIEFEVKALSLFKV